MLYTCHPILTSSLHLCIIFLNLDLESHYQTRTRMANAKSELWLIQIPFYIFDYNFFEIYVTLVNNKNYKKVQNYK